MNGYSDFSRCLLSFFCAMIAAITLRLLNPFGTGKLVLFQVTYDKVRLAEVASLDDSEASNSLGLARPRAAFLSHSWSSGGDCTPFSPTKSIFTMKQGLYGALFFKTEYRWRRYVREGTWVKRHPVVEVLWYHFPLHLSRRLRY